MSDYIKREDAAKILLQRREFAKNQDWTQEVDLMELLCERLDAVPAADVRPVVRRWWIETKTGFHCSACKSKAKGTKDGSLLSNFCPNCGAEMREVNDGT